MRERGTYTNRRSGAEHSAGGCPRACARARGYVVLGVAPSLHLRRKRDERGKPNASGGPLTYASISSSNLFFSVAYSKWNALPEQPRVRTDILSPTISGSSSMISLICPAARFV